VREGESKDIEMKEKEWIEIGWKRKDPALGRNACNNSGMQCWLGSQIKAGSSTMLPNRQTASILQTFKIFQN
jgi:hypothetical protein